MFVERNVSKTLESKQCYTIQLFMWQKSVENAKRTHCTARGKGEYGKKKKASN